MIHEKLEQYYKDREMYLENENKKQKETIRKRNLLIKQLRATLDYERHYAEVRGYAK